MAEVIGECGFKWVVADVLGKCAVGAGLVSAMVTKCDAVWFEAIESERRIFRNLKYGIHLVV